jgi:HK97 family phage major capsid protein
MTNANKVLDAAENLVDLKAVEASLGSKFDEITKAYEQANGEIKELGATKQETVAKLEALTKSYDELYDRMQTIEQKGASVSQANVAKSFGQEFIESDSYKSLIAGSARSGRMELKTAIINATGQNQPLVQSDRLQGIYTTPNRALTIRDVLPVSSTDSNLVEFTRENAFTNNAGPQVGGSPEAYENVTKPESAITFTLATAPVITLAHFIPVSKQVMADSASLASHVDGRLMYGLKLKEETQLLSGSGSNHELNGLITQATAYAGPSPLYTNEIDIIRDAIKQAHVGEYRPDMLVLNPQDWFDIEIRKVGSSDDRYVVGNPRDMMGPTLWGLPVVITNSISSGTFLLGSSMACEIKDRQQAAVEASYEDSTNFQKNMVTVRAEERIALCVYRTEAFISGSL